MDNTKTARQVKNLRRIVSDMSNFTRVIGFGDALRLEATTAPGGLNAAVKRIHDAVGKHVGTRQTFAKLFDSEDVPVNGKERLRAWLLLVALDQDPADWGMADFDPPAAFSQQSLFDLGISRIPCFRNSLDAIAA